MIKRQGVIHVQADLPNGWENSDDVSKRLLEAEQYLNGQVADEVFLRFGLGIRIHI